MLRNKKYIAVVLSMVLSVTSIYFSAEGVLAGGIVKEYNYSKDGKECIIQTQDLGNIKQSTIIYEDKKIVLSSKNNEIFTAEEYESVGKNIFGQKKYKIVNRNTIVSHGENEEENKEVKAQFSWNSKTYTPAKWGNQYWYQYGTSSYNNAYLQIGCIAKYRIAYYKLSEAKKKKCDHLTSEVKNCIELYTLGTACLNGSEIAAITAAVIAAVITIEIPVIAIVSAIVAIVGGYTTAVTLLVKSRISYLNVRDEYSIVKTYGTKQ